MKYYYKDKKNNYYAYNNVLWRDIADLPLKEDGETKEDYSTEELQAQSNFTQITETDFNNHLNAIKPKHSQEYINAQSEMAQIKMWLNENDYLINKHLLGELSDDRWNDYLTNRAIKLKRYNELENVRS